MTDDAMVGLDEALDRAERVLRGEDISNEAAAAAIVAGTIPAYYGPDATAESVSKSWLAMWDRMKGSRPGDEWFYLSNAIGWAARATA